MVVIMTIFIVGSITATVFVLAASMLSSRISQSEHLSEEYKTMPNNENSKLTPRTYPMES
jgi:hypothetical protein